MNKIAIIQINEAGEPITTRLQKKYPEAEIISREEQLEEVRRLRFHRCPGHLRANHCPAY